MAGAERRNVAGGEVGRPVLQPGWRWSEHVATAAGTESCEAPRFQYVVSGRGVARMADRTTIELGPGDVDVLPSGHDDWGVGDEPFVLIDRGGSHAWGGPRSSLGVVGGRPTRQDGRQGRDGTRLPGGR